MESADFALTCMSIRKFKVLSNPLNLEKHSGVEAVDRQMEMPPLPGPQHTGTSVGLSKRGCPRGS